MATRPVSKILSQTEIKAAKADAQASLKTANLAAKEASNALNQHRKSFAVTKAAAVKQHEALLKQLDKDHAAKDKELVKAHTAATKSVEAATKALAKVSPAPAPAKTETVDA